MRERAEMLGGILEIKANLGNGTNVKAAVPMNGNHSPHKKSLSHSRAERNGRRQMEDDGSSTF